MADLDDFFAKKDKKKKTKKFPKANTDLLASKLEEIDRKEHQAEMKAVSAAMSAGESNFTKESHPEGVRPFKTFRMIEIDHCSNADCSNIDCSNVDCSNIDCANVDCSNIDSLFQLNLSIGFK